MKNSKIRRTNLSDQQNLLKKAYELLKISDKDSLSESYLKEDQKIITSNVKNYHDTKLIINKVKKILEKIDARKLSAQEQVERRLILWLWYHHAVSYAIWHYKNKKMALKYTSMALKYQPKSHPNKITRMLYLLSRDRLIESEKWVKTIRGPEKNTATGLLNFYKEGGFFK